MKNLFVFLLVFFVGFASAYLYRIYSEKNSLPLINKKISGGFEYNVDNAPVLSKKGTLTPLFGHVLWESRIATEPARIDSRVTIEQGEKVVTDEKSKASLQFDSFGSMAIDEKVNLEIVQLLPVNFAFIQKSGTISYDVMGATSFSIRSLHLLTVLEKGKAKVSIDDETGMVKIVVSNGSAKVGYNDLDNITHSFSIPSGGIFSFDDTNRTSILK